MKYGISSPALITLTVILSSCSTMNKETTAEKFQYPNTAKGSTVDNYFGVEVQDPYRWLEDDTSKATADWVTAQNEVTSNYLDKIPYRSAVKKRIESIINYERLGVPSREGEFYYYYKNNGLQNHNVLYRTKDLAAEGEVFLDPNTFSEDGTTLMDAIYFTKDGSLATYLISEGGSDWRKAITIKTADKAIVEDTLKDLKFTGIAWKGNEGFYYSSYDKPAGSELSSKTQHHKVLYHKVGTSQKADELIFGGDKTPRRYLSASVTEDERFLVIAAATSTTGNELYVKDLRVPNSKLITLVNNFDNNHALIDNDGDKLIIQTNQNAPNSRIVVTDIGHPEISHWKDMIPETENTIESVSIAGKRIFINYLKDASTLIAQYDYAGRREAEVELPGLGSATGFSGKRQDQTVFYSFTSFTYPTTIFKYDISSGKSSLHRSPKVDFNPAAFETSQVFYTSKDGTKIPMFIVHKKGLELNGKNPTMLYGYGGFSVSLTPNFSPSRIVWLENGGVFAQPNLRGGGEYGEKWHLAGTKMNKQNVFDDFIAAAEFLFKEKYTDREHLAIWGGSNGGLLVGATMTQRPDLAKVAFPEVGVMDMLRYHTFTAGAGWAYDYGTAADSKEMFEYLYKYSPLHALKPGTSYPATMVTTADHDDRVVPAHSFKFAAALQENHEGTNPVLIRVDVKSGHSSSNLSKAIEKMSDMYSFAWYNMKVLPPLAKKDM
jgi:prolyl oligopeptidase